MSRGVNAFIVDGDEGVTLIDTGLPNRHGIIESGLAEIGRSPADVIAILLTHAHADHVGGAAALKSETSALVIASKADAPAIRGEVPPAPPPIFTGLLKPLSRLMPSAAGVEVDVEVTEAVADGLAGDFQVIDTPGHTPGHVSYLLDRAGGVLFVGDAAVSTRGGRSIGRGFMNRKSKTFDGSLAHLAEQDFQIACFGHSRAIRKDASKAFQDFVGTI